MSQASTKPYLLRAIYEWCADNGFTPYIAVHVDERTQVPREHVRGGEIVLNVSAMATNRLSIGNDFIEFQARFGGVPRELSIPVDNVTAIYARENGHGMAFEVAKAPAGLEPQPAGTSPAEQPAGRDAAEPASLTPVPGRGEPTPGGGRRGATLAAVDSASGAIKGEDAAPAEDADEAEATESDEPGDDGDGGGSRPAGRRSRARLTRIK